MDHAENEARILKSLAHQNIVKYCEQFTINKFFYIIMEYCDNLDLKAFIKEYKNNNKFIDQNIIYLIVLDICSGIKEIHKKNIIHRDLKPENIFISKDYKIKIGDFGISKKLNKTEHAKTQNIGTEFYMAPELIEGEEQYDNKVDIWALGCIIYELFTLEVCFYSKNRLQLFNKILEGNYQKINLEVYSSEWQNLIDSLLKINSEDRPDIEEVYNKVIELKNVKAKKNNYNSLDKISSGILNRDNTSEKKRDSKNIFSFCRMFRGCPYLEHLDISVMESCYVNDYSEMCKDCVKLKTILLPTIHNGNAKMDGMFQNCPNLEKIYINNSLNIDQLKNQLKKDKINPEIIIKKNN